MHPIKHFRTITKHRHLVMQGCFRVGLIWQGLTHDLSKYSPEEFWQGAKYWQGNRSPNAGARDAVGYSTAWMHHKGRNKHHYEYWTDLRQGTHRYEPVPMPTRYMVESVIDRIAACKIYNGKNYQCKDPLEYLTKAQETPLLHPKTHAQFLYILTMLRDCDEKETFRFIRKVVLKDTPMEQWDACRGKSSCS